MGERALLVHFNLPARLGHSCVCANCYGLGEMPSAALLATPEIRTFFTLSGRRNATQGANLSTLNLVSNSFW